MNWDKTEEKKERTNERGGSSTNPSRPTDPSRHFVKVNSETQSPERSKDENFIRPPGSSGSGNGMPKKVSHNYMQNSSAQGRARSTMRATGAMGAGAGVQKRDFVDLLKEVQGKYSSKKDNVGSNQAS